MEQAKLVCIGGGHGLGRLLVSLRDAGEHLTGIVATTDEGPVTDLVGRFCDVSCRRMRVLGSFYAPFDWARAWISSRALRTAAFSGSSSRVRSRYGRA